MNHNDYQSWSKLWNLSTVFMKNQYQKQQIDHLRYSDQVDHLINIISQQPLPAIVALHHYQALPTLLKKFIKILDKETLYPTKFISKVIYLITIIYITSYECLLQNLTDYPYRDIYSVLKSKLLLQTKIDSKQINKGRRAMFAVLLTRLFEIQEQNQEHLKRKELNRYINEQLLVEQPETYCQEVFFNWIKKYVEVIQHEDESRICCRVHFQHHMNSNLGKFQESSNHQFKDYRWPLENQSIIFHLTKTIVGFMNTTGGIIFVGLKQDKQKIITVNGIKLSKKQKLDFLYFLHDQILNGVYPKDNKDNDESPDYKMRLKEEFDLNKRKKIKQYRINRYVYADFLDVFDQQKLLNSRENECELYIIRIKIKIGDYKQLYHVLDKKKEIPQAFVRAQKSVRKKVLKQFFDQFYKRMATSNQIAGQTINSHPNCRFNAKCTQL